MQRPFHPLLVHVVRLRYMGLISWRAWKHWYDTQSEIVPHAFVAVSQRVKEREGRDAT